MSVLKSLLDTYNVCEKNNLIDRHNGDNTVLLPLFHTNLRSSGDNILDILLDIDSDIIKVDFLQKDKVIIFPVTIDSASRTSSPSAHPLIDQLAYMLEGNEDKHELYMEAFDGLREFINEGKESEFLEIIYKFINSENVFDKVIERLFGNIEYEKKDKYKIKYKDDRDKIKTIDFEKIFLHFTISNFDNGRDVSVTEFEGLHKKYIDYVKSSIESNGICNISGKEDFMVNKHRGLMGNAKIISVSNQNETYFGRFKLGTDIINIGYETSEKVHLMLKYLLENKNSRSYLSENQYFINWFKEDVSNNTEIDISSSKEYYVDDNEYIISDDNTKDNALSFNLGKNKIDDNWSYYAMIVDKASNGRITIKYYNELKGSDLVQNIKRWAEKYIWERYSIEKKDMIKYQPAFYELLNGAYGIDRDGRLIFDNGSFKKDQYQKFITNLLEGRDLPDNIKNAYKINIRHRMKYKKSWKYMLSIAMAVLSTGRKEYMDMIPIERQSRSYLYGRLLSIYENMERAVFARDEKSKGNERITNAEKFWSSYNNKPATIMMTLENNIKPYEKKLKLSEGKKGIYYKMKNEKDEIINEIADKEYNSEKKDKSLDYDFIFGYYAERKFLFTSKEKETN